MIYGCGLMFVAFRPRCGRNHLLYDCLLYTSGINTLTKIERGEGNPTIEVLEKILDTLGLELQIGIKQRNEL